MTSWQAVKANLYTLAQEPLLLALVLLWALLRIANVIRKIVNENQEIEVRVFRDVIIIRKDIHTQQAKGQTQVEEESDSLKTVSHT